LERLPFFSGASDTSIITKTLHQYVGKLISLAKKQSDEIMKLKALVTNLEPSEGLKEGVVLRSRPPLEHSSS